MTNDKTDSAGGLEPPSTPLIIVLVFIVAMASTIACASLAKRLRRHRYTRTLVDDVLPRLPFRSLYVREPPPPPEAQPSKYMRRFAGVSVVDGNAIIDRAHYEQLRQFPQAIVEVSEVGTNVDSADFSVTEMATTMTSVCSRSGTRLGASRTQPAAMSGGDSWTWDPARFNPSGSISGCPHPSHSAAVPPSALVQPQTHETAVRLATIGSRGSAVHLFPPTTTATTTNAAQISVAVPSPSPGSRDRTVTVHQDPDHPMDAATLAHVLHSLQSSPVQRAAPGTFATCVITNMSVDDVAAHCASQQIEQEEQEWAAEEGDVDAPHHCRRAAASGGEAAGTQFAFIMQQKAERVREEQRRAVVTVGDTREHGVSVSGSSVGSSVEVSSLSDAPSQEEDQEEEDEEAGVGDSEAAANGGTLHDTPIPGGAARPHTKRPVRREHHRHHTHKGGYIFCEDDATQQAGRRTRRGKSGKTNTKRIVFQLRKEDALYGSAEYIPRGEDSKDDSS